MDLNSLPYQPHSHGSSGDVIVSEMKAWRGGYSRSNPLLISRRLLRSQSLTHNDGSFSKNSKA